MVFLYTLCIAGSICCEFIPDTLVRQTHVSSGGRATRNAFMPMLTRLHSGVPSNRLELNGRVAATLSSPVLAVIDARAGATPGSLFNTASIAIDGLKGCGAEVLGVALNRVCLSTPLGIKRAGRTGRVSGCAQAGRPTANR